MLDNTSQPAVDNQPAPGSAPAPSQPVDNQPQPQQPAAPQPQDNGQQPGTPPIDNQQQQPQVSLYELPDGRQVDGEQLAKEWKENFLPDYTRKSQAIAALERVGFDPNNINQPQQQQPQTPPWRDPNWIPQSYSQIIDAAKAELLADQAQQAYQQEQQVNQVNAMVNQQLATIKKLEPNVNEELVFQHANKYGFPDLVAAYRNMVDMNVVRASTERRVQQNMQQRANEPIAAKPGGDPTPQQGVDYNSIAGNRTTAVEYLQGLMKR